MPIMRNPLDPMVISCKGKNVHMPEKAWILICYIEARTKLSISILVIEYEISQTTLQSTANNIKCRHKHLIFD